MVTVPKTTILPDHLPPDIYRATPGKMDSLLEDMMPLDEAVEKITKELIVKTYQSLQSSYKVAEKLCISQSKASRLIRRYIVAEKDEGRS